MIYDLILAIGAICYLPKILLSKKKGPSLAQRLGHDLPDPAGRKVIWIHSVSLGETKSVAPLLKELRKKYPEAFFLITTATATGFEEAKRLGADAVRYLPLDFSWIMRKWANHLKPELLLLIESDFWIHLLKYVHKVRGRVLLVSGKISERSARRFSTLRFFAHRLFSFFDRILVQNEEHRARFARFVPDLRKLLVGGNLKLSAQPASIDRTKWEPIFQSKKFRMAVACTHAPEEEELLDALQEIEGQIFLAPRHPERFHEVASLLNAKKIRWIAWSKIAESLGSERVILIDAMGQLPILYTFCDLAIIAGSFSSKIGGHNVLEPCLYKLPVFFGPSMHQQKEFAERALTSGAGKQISSAEMAREIRAFQAHPEPMRQAAQILFSEGSGAVEKVLSEIESAYR